METVFVDVYEAEEGGYYAEVPEMPGCLTEADSLDDLVKYLWDAIGGWTAVQLGAEATPATHALNLRIHHLERTAA